jgi:sec-independent protein translocase protein TatC
MTAIDDPAKATSEPTDDGLGTMTLVGHLAELRRRLLICILAVVVASAAAWFFYDQLLTFMRSPYCSFVHHHRSKSISGYAGITLVAPVWLWELWKFITPGLYKNEKRYIVPFVAGAVALFALGVTTAILVFPKALDWLISVSGRGVVPLFSPSRYFTLYMAMALIFGLVFMYPLVLVFLELVGLVPSKTWRRWRRPAIVVICVVAAVITPSSDPFSFMAMAVPMVLFYEGSILLGRAMGK